MPLPPEFRVTETADSLRIEWDNHEVAGGKRDFAILFVAWLVVVGFTLFISRELVAAYDLPPDERVEFSEAGLFCCGVPVLWCAVLMMPYYLAQLTWREAIEVTRSAVTHSRIGRFAPEPEVFPLATVEKVLIVWEGPNPNVDEALQTHVLVVLNTGLFGSSRAFSGRFSGPQHEAIFLTLRDFAARAGVPLAFEEKGTRPAWASSSRPS